MIPSSLPTFLFITPNIAVFISFATLAVSSWSIKPLSKLINQTGNCMRFSEAWYLMTTLLEMKMQHLKVLEHYLLIISRVSSITYNALPDISTCGHWWNHVTHVFLIVILLFSKHGNGHGKPLFKAVHVWANYKCSIDYLCNNVGGFWPASCVTMLVSNKQMNARY